MPLVRGVDDERPCMQAACSMGLPAHARKQRIWGEMFALGRVCNASEAKWQAARRPEQWSLHVLLIPDPANKSAGYTATFIFISSMWISVGYCQAPARYAGM